MVDIGIMSLQGIIMVLALAIQLMNSASQPGVSPEVKQSAITAANTAISVALSFVGQQATSTTPVATSTNTLPPPFDNIGAGMGTPTGTQVVNIPVEIPVATSTPPELIEVPFEQIAKMSYRQYATDAGDSFYIDPVLPPRDSSELYYRGTMTINGETRTLDPLKEDNQGGDIFRFLTLSPDTDYTYAVRVESQGKFGTTTGTVHTHK